MTVGQAGATAAFDWRALRGIILIVLCPKERTRMPATELKFTSAGIVAGKELLIPTGEQGVTITHVQDWVNTKLKSRSPLKDVSSSVLVKGIKQWAAYEEKVGSKKVTTIFKIT